MLQRIGVPLIIALLVTPGSSALSEAAPVGSAWTLAAGWSPAPIVWESRQAAPGGGPSTTASAGFPDGEAGPFPFLPVSSWMADASRWLDARGVATEIWVGLGLLAVLGLGLWFRWCRGVAAKTLVGREVVVARHAAHASHADAAGALAPGYFRKMLGTTRGSPPRVGWSEIFWSWIGAFLGIGCVALLNQLYLAGTDLTLVIGSLGASAVLTYGAPRSPLAQPRNLIGGHLLSALVGVVVWKLLPHAPVIAPALAVATAIALMHATKTLHPPGGATALIAVIGSQQIHDLGFFYCLVPATLSPSILLVVALLVNNLPASRRYPENWY